MNSIGVNCFYYWLCCLYVAQPQNFYITDDCLERLILLPRLPECQDHIHVPPYPASLLHNFLKLEKKIMCMNVLCLCMFVYHVHVCSLWRPQEGVRSREAGLLDGCAPPCGCWESNQGFQMQSHLKVACRVIWEAVHLQTSSLMMLILVTDEAVFQLSTF